jgi:lipopolysaccharide/colanic/teichoic acid biosynthesis glycosyltransferase
MKRLFDIVMSFVGALIALPFLLVIALLVKLTSKGPVFYLQTRVGLHGKDFKIIKFRTMYVDSDKQGLLSLGDKDPRITTLGHMLRKFRLDEIPQFFNILKGEMSFVGPRPEVRKYVDYYTEAQKEVLNFKPGATDYACLIFLDVEDKILNDNRNNVDEVYIQKIMPEKVAKNLEYFRTADFFSDLRIILLTIKKTFNIKRH